MSTPDAPPETAETGTWRFPLDGVDHQVVVPKPSALTGPRTRVEVDGKDLDLDAKGPGGARTGATSIGGHRIDVTRTVQRPTLVQRLRGAFAPKNFARSLAIGLVAGPGAGGASTGMGSWNQQRFVYALTVDGEPRGAWIWWLVGYTGGWVFEADPVNPFARRA